MKRLRVGFWSAMEFWRMVRRAGAEPEAMSQEERVFGARDRGISERVRAALALCGAEGPLEVVVPSAPERIHSSLVRNRVWGGPTPERSLVRLGGGVDVFRAPAMFTQLATLLDEVGLAEVAYELTGTYVVDPGSGDGFGEAPALTTVSELVTYASAAKALGVRGATRAVGALSLVVDGSHSPRESVVAIMLATGRSRGGAGVSGFRMNVTVHLPEDLASRVGQRVICPDFSWPNGTVGEYDSDMFHRGPRARARDERKRRAYQSVGMDCLTMTRGTFQSNDELDFLFDDLEKSLGLRRSPPNEHMLAARYELRERLFGPELDEEALLSLGAGSPWDA